MPALFVDTEQAALIKVAVEMLHNALSARVERANPGKIISDSLNLQANKLATVMAQLAEPDPPVFSRLDEPLRRAALNAATVLVATPQGRSADAAWNELRSLAIAPGLAREPAA